MAFRIEAVHAFVAVDEDGEEGIIGMQTMKGWLPFVAADKTRLDQLRPIAQSIANQTNKEVRLLRFAIREDVEVLEPGREGND